MTSAGPTMHQTMHQTTYRVLRRQLHSDLLDALSSGPRTTGGRGLAGCRATAALYVLLLEHPVDARGHCRSCRRPGAVIGRRRRRCLVYRTANFWLTRPTTAMLWSALASELGLPLPPPLPRARTEPGWPTRLVITGRPGPPGTAVLTEDPAACPGADMV